MDKNLVISKDFFFSNFGNFLLKNHWFCDKKIQKFSNIPKFCIEKG
jgi:hypothetical protein